MCGIIGYAGGEFYAAPLIISGLKRLEYRGYDSSGLAVLRADTGSIEVIKKQGRISALELAADFAAEKYPGSLCGNLAIGHTRWATHGEPSDINSHPHLSKNGRFAIVHNGIIENYRQLRRFLQREGYAFSSETDSEVIAHLIEYYYLEEMQQAGAGGQRLHTVLCAINRAISALSGSYAAGVICADYPDALFSFRKDNPLIVGIADGGCFIASDIPAILPYTNQMCRVEEGEIAVLSRSGALFYNAAAGSMTKKEPQAILWDAGSAEKDGYAHFMLKEIMQQPKVVRDTVHSLLAKNMPNYGVLRAINIAAFRRIVIVGCGSAYNAGMAGKYVLEQLTRLSVEVEFASEFRSKEPIIGADTLVILISQSGETADTLAALRKAKSKNAATLAIVNVVGSAIAKEADKTIYTLAGPEIAVATTKAFSAQLAALYILAASFAKKLGKISLSEYKSLLKNIRKLPTLIEKTFELSPKIAEFAKSCACARSIFFIGRNVDYAIALEGSLKLKEISYIHSEAYASGELKHGTISLIEKNTLVVAISNCRSLHQKLAGNAEQTIARGARALFLSSSAQFSAFKKHCVLRLPKTRDYFSPSVSVIALQLLAYFVAAEKGCDIDKPRNLAKSVTVE